MLNDFVSWTYVIGLILFAYGTFLFVYELIRRKGGSWIFYYICLLLFGGVVTYSVDVFARHLRFENLDNYYAFMDSFVWNVRRIPIILSVLFIDIHATVKIADRLRTESNETNAPDDIQDNKG